MFLKEILERKLTYFAVGGNVVLFTYNVLNIKWLQKKRSSSNLNTKHKVSQFYL